MNQGDEVLYTIAISGIADNKTVSLISTRLKNHEVHGQYQRIRPAIEKTGEPGAIFVPRLFTRWRGNDTEKAWQKKVKAACTHGDQIVTIRAEPWSPAAGYPINTMEETK